MQFFYFLNHLQSLISKLLRYIPFVLIRIKHRGLGKKSSNQSVELVELSSSEESDSSSIKIHDSSLSDTVIASSSSSEESHINRNAVISEELKKIKDIPPNLALVQTFYEHPWLKKDSCVEIPLHKWTYSIDSAKGSIRSATFSYLWNEGFYLTAGDKFGADFLAYPGMRYILMILVLPKTFLHGPINI